MRSKQTLRNTTSKF